MKHKRKHKYPWITPTKDPFLERHELLMELMPRPERLILKIALATAKRVKPSTNLIQEFYINKRALTKLLKRGKAFYHEKITNGKVWCRMWYANHQDSSK